MVHGFIKYETTSQGRGLQRQTKQTTAQYSPPSNNVGYECFKIISCWNPPSNPKFYLHPSRDSSQSLRFSYLLLIKETTKCMNSTPRTRRLGHFCVCPRIYSTWFFFYLSSQLIETKGEYATRKNTSNFNVHVPYQFRMAIHAAKIPKCWFQTAPLGLTSTTMEKESSTNIS